MDQSMRAPLTQHFYTYNDLQSDLRVVPDLDFINEEAIPSILIRLLCWYLVITNTFMITNRSDSLSPRLSHPGAVAM